MWERVNGWGSRYGWGVVCAAAPFVNAIAVMTAGLGCFLLLLFFSMFGIDPGPPSQTLNPISWMLYFLVFACYGWWIWSMMLFYFLVPVGLAWSLGDLLLARARGDQERAIGAAAGLALTLIPLILYLRATANPMADFNTLAAGLRLL